MHPRQFAFFGGLFLLIFGLMSFFPAMSPITTGGLVPIDVNASYGAFLGLFPMNAFNKFLFVILGGSGWIASSMQYTELPHSIHFARFVFWILAPLTLLGAFPETQTLFGLCPLYGPTNLLYGVLALIGAYQGYVMPFRASRNPVVKGAHSLKHAWH